MKKSLNSDGHQFLQYQQNEQSPLILTELSEQKNDQDIKRWKSRSWFVTGTKMWLGLNLLSYGSFYFPT